MELLLHFTPIVNGQVLCPPRMQDHAEIRAVIPRRTALLADRGVLIVAFATHKQKSLFFFLVQVRLPAQL